MSGIEVAGIALAVFPILVKGISKGAETIKYWRRCRARLEDYADLIESQEKAYLDTLEKLLGDIIHSDDELRLLLSDPRGSAWHRPEYDARLRQRLDRSYDVYIRTAKGMHDDLEKLRKRLGISPSGEVLWNNCSPLEREMKKLKVALLKDVNKGLVENIDKANEKIHQMVNRNVDLEPMRTRRKSRHSTADIRQIRRHAASLHYVLIADSAWRCPCKKLHVASLRLESRLGSQEDVKSGLDTRFSFCILVSTVPESANPPAVRRWQDIEVRPSVNVSSAPSSEPSSGRPGKGVRFAPDPLTIRKRQPPSPDNDVLIADVCSALGQVSAMHECMGFLLDERDLHHRHHLYLAESASASTYDPRSRSLSDLLASPQSNTADTLFHKERLEIAITLASSVLQLDGTQWLKSQWTSNDIYFHKGISPGSATCYRYPYLPWKRCTNNGDLSAAIGSMTPNSHFIRSKALFALGLTLVELCFGKTLKSMREPEDEDANEAVADMNCAFRLLRTRSVWRNMGEVYESVVRRCLNQTFDVPDMDLDNEDLQQQVYETVVMPLTDELNDFLSVAIGYSHCLCNDRCRR